MEPYLYLSGLKRLSGEVRGDETIHLGIRPYGFHAGNTLAILLYPYLLCKYVKERGIEASFRFIVSLNDYEQDCLDGPDIIRYPFNVYPKNSSLKHTPDENNCCESIVEHWQPIIKKEFETLFKDYQKVQITFVRNSELRDHPVFKELLLRTLRNPLEQGDIMRKLSGKEVLDTPLSYAGVICPNCRRSQGDTKITMGDAVSWSCKNCKISLEKPYNQFDYWWHHKSMLLARLKIFNIDITISGGDHYNEGDFSIRKALFDLFFQEQKIPKMLFSPLLDALDGRKMSKSRSNMALADKWKLLAVAENNFTDTIQLTSDLLADSL